MVSASDISSRTMAYNFASAASTAKLQGTTQSVDALLASRNLLMVADVSAPGTF